MRRLPDIVLGPAAKRDQRLRVRRFFMALASYTMWYLLALAGDQLGVLELSPDLLVWVTAALLATNLLIYLTLRSGLNLRFRDPSMTFLQLIIALLWVLVLMAATVEVRGLMMLVFLVTMLFGIFHLTQRGFIAIASIAFVMFAGLVLMEELFLPGRVPAVQQLLSLLVLGGILAWSVLFGSYVSNLRHRLVERNLALQEALDRIHELAIRDDLTGIFNRRHIMQSLSQLKARADRYNQSFSICLLDLDRFKLINDEYGHAAGDAVLKRFAELTQETLRGLDTVGIAADEPMAEAGRFGGEEFLVILPETDLEGARRAAERLLEAVRDMRVDDVPGPLRVTFSAGVAEYRRGERVRELIGRADEALYRAKDDGRNLIRVAGNE